MTSCFVTLMSSWTTFRKINMTNRLIDEFNRITEMTPERYHALTNSTVADWHDGSLLHRAQEWVDCLHKQRGKKILIIPDYDSDGVMSGLIIYAALYVLGWTDVHIYYPTMATGYGLSVESLNEALSEMPDAEVIITTDNGIKAYDGVAEAKRRGLVVLVTDHHPGVEEEPEADVIVDPNSFYDDTYPFKAICGGEVAYKLMSLYAKQHGSDQERVWVNALYPFAGISAVADMMDMVDENRFLVKETVSYLSNFYVDNSAPKEYLRLFKGLWALLEELKDNGKLKYGVDADTIGFYISPMLNASRRVMSTSKYAFQVFMEDDVTISRAHARELWAINEHRKNRSNALSQAAMAQWNGYDSMVTVIDAGIGYPGLVAGQLTGAFDMPAVVFSYEVTGDGLLVPDDYVQPGYMLHGSGRAPEWFHMGNAMTRIHSRNPEWFVSWGGHAGALGCVIYSEFLHEFKIALAHEVGLAEEYARLNSTPGSINVIEVHDSDAGLVQEYCDYIATLEPFGQGFGRVPVKYSIELGTLQAIKTMGAEQQHLKLATGVFDVLIWNYQTKAHIEKVMSGQRGSVVEFTGTLGVNEWNGRVTPQFVVDTIL